MLNLEKIDYYKGDYAEARMRGEQALLCYQALADRPGEAIALTHLANVVTDQGDYATAIGQYQQALAIHRETGDRYAEGIVLHNLADTYREDGQYAMAADYFDQVLTLCRSIADQQGEGQVLSSLGVLHLEQGKYTAASRYYAEAYAICHFIGAQHTAAMVRGEQGLTYHYQGDYERAATCYTESLALCIALGDQRGTAHVLALQSLLAHHQGNNETAFALSQHALEHVRIYDLIYEGGNALLYHGHALVALGLLANATTTYTDALALFEDIGHAHQAQEARAGLARVCLTQDNVLGAYDHIKVILDYLYVHPWLYGTDEPFRVYLTCAQVLQASGDDRAVEILQTGTHLLHERATQIEDDHLRCSYLNSVAAHRELLATARSGGWMLY